MSRLIDLTGRRFGRLIVIERVGNNKWGHHRWLCKCEDENEVTVLGNDLKSGRTKSCGCLSREGSNLKHGLRHNKIYPVWNGMIQRCYNSKCKAYKNYGGRGITVCDRWKNSPVNFIQDMVKGWESGLTLERRKNEEGYCLDNCYWGTRTEQARNTRRNHLISCLGKLQCIAAWSEETGISARTIRWRIKNGWLPEKALTIFVRKRRK